MKNITIAVILSEKYKIKRESEKRGEDVYDIKLRVTHEGYQRYYSTKTKLTKKEFKEARKTKGKKAAYLKGVNDHFYELEKKAWKIIDQMNVFTFDTFTKRWNDNRNMAAVLSCFDEYTEELIKSGKVGSASTYTDASKSIKRYLKSINIKENEFRFKNITVDWLNGYENYMKDLGRSKTTIGIYLRPLRAIINKYSKLDPALYPFGNNKSKFTIKTGKGRKVFLNEDEIKTLFQHQAEDGFESLALDLYKFSFFCNGCNMKDILIMKKENIDLDNGVLYLMRAKTEDTEKERTEVKVTINSFMRKFIFKYQDAENEIYQFKFIEPDPDKEPEKWLKRKRDFIGTINDNLRKIASDVGIKKNLTHGTSRHTFATTLLREKIPIKEISRRLCHKSITTTENYLHGLGHKIEMQADQVLDKFESFA